MSHVRTIPCLLLAAGAPLVAQQTIHVAPCGNNSWTGSVADCAAPFGPKRTIQAAINVAQNGDTILVAPGLYTGSGNYDIDFGGRAITLMCAGGLSCTIAPGTSWAIRRRAFHFHSGETQESIVHGFSITGGHHTRGGAILIENSSPLIRECTLEFNAVHPPPAGQGDGGGAVYIAGGSPVFLSCIFRSNSVALAPGSGFAGGGAVRSHAASPVFRACYFVWNQLSGDPGHVGVGGGAIMATGGGTLELRQCAFVQNASSFDAGAVLLWGTSAAAIDCGFHNNIARNAGAYLAINGGTTNFSNCTFSANSADECCGAAAFVDVFADIARARFSGNSAGTEGGAVLLQQLTDLRMRNITFDRNSALGGGAIWVGDGTIASIDAARIAGNAAIAEGGGAAVVRGGIASFTNSLFIGNTADLGGAIAVDHNSAATVVNATMVDNAALSAGGAFYLGPANPIVHIHNSILWFNQAAAIPVPPSQQVHIAGGTATILHSNIQDGTPGPGWAGGAGVFTADPGFVNRAASDYRLTARSPSIDAGDDSLLPPHITTDLDGNPRRAGNAIDMGAFEFQQAGCYANCDNSTTEPILSIDDFTCFINEFAAAQTLPHEEQITHYANCDGSTTAPVLNVDDFTCFINAFASGCP